MVQNMDKVKIDVQENIQLGQCYNLAHAELLSKGKIPSECQDELERVTFKLFFIKERINIRLALEKKKLVDPIRAPSSPEREKAIKRLMPLSNKMKI